MQLIMRSEFDNLRLNDAHEYDVNTSGNKHVVKIYANGQLIAKRIKIKKSLRYFGCKNYREFLTDGD